jgi:hypothetical protein
MPKPQKFKRFSVTDVEGLNKAYPGVVRQEPRADPFKVQKLLDCGIDLSQWVKLRDPQEDMLAGSDVVSGGVAE